MAAIAGWTIAGFCTGAVPFAYLVGRIAGHEDIREFGSHNPGGMNVWRTLGGPFGAAVIFLDLAKGLVPVGLAHFVFGISGWPVMPVALAPILGHAYTPLLRFRGGKAVAVSFGVWAGLLGLPGALLLALAQGTFLIVWRSDSWVSAMGMLLFVVFLWLTGAGLYLIAIAVVDGLIIAQRYSREFKDGVMPRFAREGG